MSGISTNVKYTICIAVEYLFFVIVTGSPLLSLVAVPPVGVMILGRRIWSKHAIWGGLIFSMGAIVLVTANLFFLFEKFSINPGETTSRRLTDAFIIASIVGSIVLVVPIFTRKNNGG